MNFAKLDCKNNTWRCYRIFNLTNLRVTRNKNYVYHKISVITSKARKKRQIVVNLINKRDFSRNVTTNLFSESGGACLI